MGLIKAGIGALGGTLADQWKEFFYCLYLSLSNSSLMPVSILSTISRIRSLLVCFSAMTISFQIKK